MKKVLKVLAGIESVVCTAAFIIMLTFCFFQVLNRNIFKIPLGWTEELSRFSMVWMALLGSELGLRKGKQMAVAAVVSKLPFVPKKIVECLGCIISGAFAGVSGYYALQFVASNITNGQIAPALNVPMWIVYLILPISLFLMFLFEVYNFFHILLQKREQTDEEGGCA